MPQPTELPKIALHSRDFAQTLKRGDFMVDKTTRLCALTNYSKVFFTRPRYFGKHTLVSMLEELFTHGTAKFKGFAVADTWDQRCYPVIRLNCSRLSNPATLEHDLGCHLIGAFAQAGYSRALNLLPLKRSLLTICHYLDDLRSITPIVVLVESWDSPLTTQLFKRANYEANLALLNHFYSWLINLPNVHFTLITGVSRFSDCVVSQDPRVIDLSFAPDFADLLGFTPDEIDRNFAPYQQQACGYHPRDLPEIWQKLQAYYGGFCFDPTGQTSVASARAIALYFNQVLTHPKEKLKFNSFWADFSERRVLELLTHYEPSLDFLSALTGSGLSLKLTEDYLPSATKTQGLVALLAQVGIITLKGASADTYRWSLPNQEVELSFSRHFISYLFGATPHQDNAPWFHQTYQRLSLMVQGQAMGQVMMELNVLLQSISAAHWEHISPTAARTLVKWLLRYAYGVQMDADLTNYNNQVSLWGELSGCPYLIAVSFLPQESSSDTVATLLDAGSKQLHDTDYKVPQHKHKYFSLVVVVSERGQQIMAWRRMCQNKVIDEGRIDPAEQRAKTDEVWAEERQLPSAQASH